MLTPRWHRRAYESRLNTIPSAAHFTTVVGDYTLHFLSHVSANANAQPLVLLHGWPGDFTEYLPLLEHLISAYPDKYNIIIPSLPGYTFSGPPPSSRAFTFDEVAAVLNELMVGVGYTQYVAVGGDIGSFMANSMSHHAACKGVHMNMIIPHTMVPASPDAPEIQHKALQRKMVFTTIGNAYLREQASRPNTISAALSASPLALLAWVGEKYLEWTDTDPSLQTILEHTTLWWLTQTYATSIWPYRLLFGAEAPPRNPAPVKRWGYSWFPDEIMQVSKEQLEREAEVGEEEGRLVYVGWHESGGHWPGFEKPVEFAADIAETLKRLE